jgi:hypothetical protein
LDVEKRFEALLELRWGPSPFRMLNGGLNFGNVGAISDAKEIAGQSTD